MSDFRTVYNSLLLYQNSVNTEVLTLQSQFDIATDKLKSLVKQQEINEKARVALEQAKPYLTAATIEQLEELINTALSTIFDIDGKVSYDIESKRFILNENGNVCDLADATGGGIVTVISFIFDLVLLFKKGCRKLLVYDEAFYAVSDAFYADFIKFVRKSCTDLGVDLLLVSHDARLDFNMVDRVYRIEDGKSIRVK